MLKISKEAIHRGLTKSMKLKSRKFFNLVNAN